MSEPAFTPNDPRAYLTPAEAEAVKTLCEDDDVRGRIAAHGPLKAPSILNEMGKDGRAVSWQEHNQLMERVAILEAFCDALVGESRQTRKFGLTTRGGAFRRKDADARRRPRGKGNRYEEAA